MSEVYACDTLTSPLVIKGLEPATYVHFNPVALGGSKDGLMVEVLEGQVWLVVKVGELGGTGGRDWLPRWREFIVEFRVACTVSAWVEV